MTSDELGARAKELFHRAMTTGFLEPAEISELVCLVRTLVDDGRPDLAAFAYGGLRCEMLRQRRWRNTELALRLRSHERTALALLRKGWHRRGVGRSHAQA